MFANLVGKYQQWCMVLANLAYSNIPAPVHVTHCLEALGPIGSYWLSNYPLFIQVVQLHHSISACDAGGHFEWQKWSILYGNTKLSVSHIPCRDISKYANYSTDKCELGRHLCSCSHFCNHSRMCRLFVDIQLWCQAQNLYRILAGSNTTEHACLLQCMKWWTKMTEDQDDTYM